MNHHADHVIRSELKKQDESYQDTYGDWHDEVSLWLWVYEADLQTNKSVFKSDMTWPNKQHDIVYICIAIGRADREPADSRCGSTDMTVVFTDVPSKKHRHTAEGPQIKLPVKMLNEFLTPKEKQRRCRICNTACWWKWFGIVFGCIVGFLVVGCLLLLLIAKCYSCCSGCCNSIRERKLKRRSAMPHHPDDGELPLSSHTEAFKYLGGQSHRIIDQVLVITIISCKPVSQFQQPSFTLTTQSRGQTTKCMLALRHILKLTKAFQAWDGGMNCSLPCLSLPVCALQHRKPWEFRLHVVIEVWPPSWRIQNQIMPNLWPYYFSSMSSFAHTSLHWLPFH